MSDRERKFNDLARLIVGGDAAVPDLVRSSTPSGSTPTFRNPMTGVGDIIVGKTHGSPGRLGPGTDGQVLTVQPDGTLAWGDPGSGTYSDEQAQDAVGAIVAASPSVVPVYDDATPALTFEVVEEWVRDLVETFLVAGTGVTLTPDDLGDTLEIAAAGGGGAVDSVNGQTGIVLLDSDDIAEGANLYYTDERARDALGTALVPGNNIDITTDDGLDTITIAVESLTSADITDFTGAVGDIMEEGMGEDGAGTTEWLHNHRYASMSANGGPGVTAIGFVGPGTSQGTTTNGDDTDGLWVQHTGSSATAGVTMGRALSAGPLYADHGLTGAWRMKTGPDVTSVRYWYAFSDVATLTSFDVPGTGTAGFRASTSAGDTNWQAVTCNPSGCTITDTGIAFAADVAHWFRVHFGTNTARFYIDDTLVATHQASSGHFLPLGGIQLGWWARITQLAAATRSFRFGALSISVRN